MRPDDSVEGALARMSDHVEYLRDHYGDGVADRFQDDLSLIKAKLREGA